MLLIKNKKQLFYLKNSVCLFLFLLSCFQLGYSQNITNYTFSASSGTYTAISGSTQVSGMGAYIDDDYANSISIGFDFFYMGTRYNYVGVTTNGWITLGSGSTSLSTYDYTNNLSTGPDDGTRPIIAPLWDDLETGSAGKVHYVLSGSAPNRVFTIEWKQMMWDYLGSDPCISFQVKLYETTGVIVFVYNRETYSPSSASASVGLAASATGSGNFLSLNGTGSSPTASSTSETTSLSSRPATNQTYTFTPPTTSAPTSASFSCVHNTTITLNWTNNGSNRVVTAIYKSTDNVTFTYVGTATSAATSYTATGLTANTTYYWKIYSVSEGYMSTALSAGSQATTNSASSGTWTGCSSTDWFTAGNWEGGSVPTSSTDVTIPSGTSNSPSITGSADAYCRALTINSGATLTLNQNSGGWSFYVYGNISNNGTFTHSNGASASSGGDYWLTYRGTSGATIGGSGTYTTLGLWISSGVSTDANLTRDLTVAALYVNSGASPEAKISLSTYTLTVTSGFWQYGMIYLNSGTLEIQSTSATFSSQATNFIPGTGTLYRNVSANVTSSIAWTNLYNYKISCSGFTFTQSGSSVTVTNNFTLSAGTYSVGSNTLNVGKDFSNSGTFTYGTSTVNFNGSAAQQILGSSATSFYNATLNNSTGLTLAPSAGIATTVRNTLTLTSGKLTLGNFDLNIGAAAVSGSIASASSSNYIVTSGTGVLKQYNIGTGQRTSVAYPIGISSSSYTPVTLNVVGATTVDDFSAVVSQSALVSGTTGSAYTANVVDRTWNITEGTSGSSNVTLTPQWNSGDELTSFDRTNCYVSHYTGGAWGSTAAGAAASGSNPYTIVSGTVTSFSPFGVGAHTVLPIELLDFNAVAKGKEVELTWVTATELNNDYFTIERSADAYSFEHVTIVDGAGNSNTTLNYETTDPTPLSGLSYYRLKQTDFDGKHSYSKTVPVNFAVSEGLAVYPNPTMNYTLVSFPAVTGEVFKVVVTDALGKVAGIQQHTAIDGMNVLKIDLSHMGTGMYHVLLYSTSKEFKTKIIKQ